MATPTSHNTLPVLPLPGDVLPDGQKLVSAVLPMPDRQVGPTVPDVLLGRSGAAGSPIDYPGNCTVGPQDIAGVEVPVEENTLTRWGRSVPQLVGGQPSLRMPAPHRWAPGIRRVREPVGQFGGHWCGVNLDCELSQRP